MNQQWTNKYRHMVYARLVRWISNVCSFWILEWMWPAQLFHPETSMLCFFQSKISRATTNRFPHPHLRSDPVCDLNPTKGTSTARDSCGIHNEVPFIDWKPGESWEHQEINGWHMDLHWNTQYTLQDSNVAVLQMRRGLLSNVRMWSLGLQKSLDQSKHQCVHGTYLDVNVYYPSGANRKMGTRPRSIL